jgi:NAD(P)-dependent dehydrogenase (short-subunit alcohol dehydrogenase family)
MTSDLARRVDFVTGASSGISRATALAFASTRATVVVADVSAEGKDTGRLISDAGGRALSVTCDVARSGYFAQR